MKEEIKKEISSANAEDAVPEELICGLTHQVPFEPFQPSCCKEKQLVDMSVYI